MTDLQTMINQAAAGTTVIPNGTFNIDSVNAPITLKSDITLDLSNAILNAIPNDANIYAVMKAVGVSNIRIIKGTVNGERLQHTGTTGEWGYGIQIGDVGQVSQNISIVGTDINNCWGDGIIVLNGANVSIDTINSNNNRRNAMSVICVDTMNVSNSIFRWSNGTAPNNGIDFEPDNNSQFIRNVLVSKNQFFNNKGADINFGSPGIFQNITVAPNNSFDLTTQPISINGNAGSSGTPWWAVVLRALCGKMSGYKWWGYPTSWHHT